MSNVGKDRTQPNGNASSMNHGVKNANKVANKCPEGAGKGRIGTDAGKVNPGKKKA
jgi:hypothetical protein